MQQNPYQNDYPGNAPQASVYNPYSQNLSIIKDYLKGSRTLFVFILICLSTVSAIVISVNNLLSLDVQKSYAQLLTSVIQQTIPEYPDNAIYSSTVLSVVSATFSSFTSFAVNIVAWALIYFKSKNPAPTSSPKAGVIILFVLSIIQLVSSIACAVLFTLLSLFILMLPTVLRSEAPVNLTQFDYSVLSALCYIGAIILILSAVFLLLYSIGTFNFYRSIKNSLSSARLYNKGSKLYGVTSVIIAILTAVFSIGLFAWSFALPDAFEQATANYYFASALFAPYIAKMRLTFILAALAGLISAVLCIAYARFSFGYNKYINTITQAPPMIDLNGNGDFSDEAQSGEYNVLQGESPEGICPQCKCRIKHDGFFCDNCGYRLK